jgi:hypothetical protein
MDARRDAAHRFEKIPFTCTYYPGKSRIRTLWPRTERVFLYTFTVAAGLLEFLESGRAIAVFVFISLAIILGLTVRRHHRLRDIRVSLSGEIPTVFLPASTSARARCAERRVAPLVNIAAAHSSGPVALVRLRTTGPGTNTSDGHPSTHPRANLLI